MFTRKLKKSLLLIILTLFTAQSVMATAPCFETLPYCTSVPAIESEAAHTQEDVELLEAGETVELTGQIEEADGKFTFRTNTGQSYPIVEETKIPDNRQGTFTVVTVLIPKDDQWVPALRFAEKKNAFFERVSRFFDAINIFATQNSLPDRRPQEWKFPKEVETEGKAFLLAYANYVQAAHQTLRESYTKRSVETCSDCKNPYRLLTQLNKAAYGKNQGLYNEAMAKLKAYVNALTGKGVLAKYDKKETYVAVDKVAFLLAVVDKKTKEAIYVVPVAYGAHPSGAPKEANGDLKSPNRISSSKLSPRTTPYFIGRRYRGTIVKGMTVRCMGLSSKDKADAFWVQYGMNIAFHGTPSWWSMGLRASHGCFRIQEERVKLVYELTTKDTPVVIFGIK